MPKCVCVCRILGQTREPGELQSKIGSVSNVNHVIDAVSWIGRQLTSIGGAKIGERGFTLGRPKIRPKVTHKRSI